jgi:hypothetical protein
LGHRTSHGEQPAPFMPSCIGQTVIIGFCFVTNSTFNL